MHFSLGEEANRLHWEANILYWAKVLLKLTYDYIDHCIDNANQPPLFEIPRLCFVDARLLVGFSEGPLPNAGASGKQKSGGFSSVYLAEEVITSTGGDDKFVKFIHNGDASPRKLGDPTFDEVTNFLSFTQHIQYVKTGSQVFLSDYQGKLCTVIKRVIAVNCHV
ncbi:hypothetical protein L210DRAFT_3393781 [Boletus edulis BED1]|uniref:Alpha-type protein kinase domain-containing protein n=1 Tax=Boletus edulis BED1 TaxID=1328754 RepID=A0AAD4C0S6_BOLED|nr:hypothetical protein L210DRAFT_3393781 [Boletus edulis BED1]